MELPELLELSELPELLELLELLLILIFLIFKILFVTSGTSRIFAHIDFFYLKNKCWNFLNFCNSWNFCSYLFLQNKYWNFLNFWNSETFAHIDFFIFKINVGTSGTSGTFRTSGNPVLLQILIF